MKKAVNFLLVLVLMTVISTYASASFSVGNSSHFIEKKYAPNSALTGWANLSLFNEPSSSIFSSTLGGSIGLIQLLNLNNFTKDFDYACAPSDCMPDYAPVEGSNEQTKTFALNNNSEKIIGLRFNGVSDINSINFGLQSNAPAACNNQLEVDILNDGAIDLINEKSSQTQCGSSGKKYGCFNSSKSSTLFDMNPSVSSYCEKISLLQSPGIIAGAWVKNVTSPGIVTSVKMKVFESNGFPVGECILPQINDSGGEYDCSINSSLKEYQAEYYVCISATGGEYKISGYIGTNAAEKCGFPSLPGFENTETAAYQIFAQTKQFDSFGSSSINTSSGGDLNYLNNGIFQYLLTKYSTDQENINCPVNGCIIPIRFKSKIDQTVTLSGLLNNYISSGGPTTDTNFWNITQTPAFISSDFIILNMDNARFSTSATFGTKNITLKLGNASIFSDSISVEKIPQIVTVTPQNVPAAYPTKIAAKIEKFGLNATLKYSWDFGDDSAPEISNENSITHTYSAVGNYTLTLSLTSSNYTSSKSFEIIAETPINAVNALLSKYLNSSASLRAQVEALPTFQKNSLEKIMNISELDDMLGELQQRVATAASDDDYVSIMNDLAEISIPESISETKSANNFVFIPDNSNINLDALQEISKSSETINDEQGYIDAIDGWYLANVEASLNFKEFSANYDGTSERLESVFEFSIKKGDADTAYIFIMPKLENLNFRENYNQKEIGDYVYIDLSKDGNKVDFSTTEDVDFTTLQAFIAPKISELSVIESSAPLPEDTALNTSNIIFLGSILAALVFAGFIIYIVLAYWYKKKYEDYLFKNKNDLYNIVSYVQNMKKQGVDDKKVIAALRKSGWSSEQVNYLMKKYYGKRTGLPFSGK